MSEVVPISKQSGLSQEKCRQSPFEYEQTAPSGQTIFIAGDVTTVGDTVNTTLTVVLLHQGLHRDPDSSAFY